MRRAVKVGCGIHAVSPLGIHDADAGQMPLDGRGGGAGEDGVVDEEWSVQDAGVG